jgi:hypothetical protein
MKRVDSSRIDEVPQRGVEKINEAEARHPSKDVDPARTTSN